MPNYGVIDLGSNSIRLVIYEVKNDGQKASSRAPFKSLISDKVMAGLSAFVEEGIFSPAGIERAANVLKGHMKRARYFACVRLDIFATAVLRNCSNSANAVATIEERIGAPVTLLSSHDEAHLGFIGASCDKPIEHGTLIDIGGGSTEITRIENCISSDSESIGVGSLSSFAAHIAGIAPTEQETQEVSDALWSALCSQVPDPDRYASTRFYGIGGSVRAAAKMIAQMNGLTERPHILSLADLESILDFLRADPNAYLHQALKASAERVHTIAPGVLIMHRLMSELGGREIEIRKRGVREGYLIERMLAATDTQKKARAIA